MLFIFVLLVVTCSALRSLGNGRINYTHSTLENGAFPVGTIASFTCNEGYFLIGSEAASCQTSGTWNANTPSCGN